MVRNYKRKTDRGAGGKWTQEDMEKAVQAVKDGIPLRKVAIQFNVPRSTLLLKAKGWKGRRSTLDTTRVGGRPNAIPLIEEEKLAKYLKIMGKWGFGLTKIAVLNIVQEFVQKNQIKSSFKDGRPGKDWFKSFCSRNNLSLKKPELLEGSRARQSNDPFIIYDFFDKLTKIVQDLNIQNSPESIFNCDESGFRSDPTTTKVVSAKGAPTKRVTGGNARKTTTVLATVNAKGEKLPPLILHKGKRLWDNMMGEKAYPGTSYSVNISLFFINIFIFIYLIHFFHLFTLFRSVKRVG